MKVVLFANTDWYLYNFRLPLAKKLRALGHTVVLVSPPGSFSARILAEGFEWVEFRFARKGINPFSELDTIRRLYAAYKTIQPDIVHHFTIKCVVYGGIVARLLDIPQVSSVTGTGHVFTTRSIQNSILRPLVGIGYMLALRSAQVIFQNPDDQAAFVRLRLITPNRSHLIQGSGVDMRRFQPSCIPRKDGEGIRVVMICRLLKEKGVAEFVQAAQLLKHRLPKASFKLAGEADPGNPSSVGIDQIQRWAANGNVQFLGHVEDVPALLNQSDICVLPSYYGEGVPRSLIEAAASGLPLVTTNMPGCREICRDGENGFLIAPRDAHALAAAIVDIAEDSARAMVMGARSREIAVAEFSESSVLERTLSVYRTALSEAASRVHL